MSSSSLLIERIGAVISVVLNAPQTRNALSPVMFDELGSVLESAATDGAVAAVVISGNGGFFSAGGDLNQLLANRSLEPSARLARLGKLNRMIQSIQASPVPVIAAVEGGAAGAGMSLALACDMVVASRSAKFVAAYVKAGLTPDGGLTASLAAIAPRQVVFELCALGMPVTAERMQALGAVGQVVEEGQALNAALALGDKFAKAPRRAVGRIKHLSHAACVNSMADQLALEARLMVESQGEDRKSVV